MRVIANCSQECDLITTVPNILRYYCTGYGQGFADVQTNQQPQPAQNQEQQSCLCILHPGYQLITTKNLSAPKLYEGLYKIQNLTDTSSYVISLFLIIMSILIPALNIAIVIPNFSSQHPIRARRHPIS